MKLERRLELVNNVNVLLECLINFLWTKLVRQTF